MTHVPPSAAPLPSAAVLDWIAAAVGAQAVVQRVEQLHGSTTAALYRVDVAQRGVPHALVLRRIDDHSWLQVEPDLIAHEAAVLRHLAAAEPSLRPPVPVLVAADSFGSVDGSPLLLMTQLPGAVWLTPTNPDDWLAQMAGALAAIHRIPAGDLTWQYAPYVDAETADTPQRTAAVKAWAQALAILQEAAPPPEPRIFIHRDYHPVNILWQDGRLCGVVDWIAACVGPRSVDLAHCRWNLARTHGGEWPDRFLAAYLAQCDDGYRYHPYWDLQAAVESLPEPAEVYRPWTHFGLTDLTPRLVQARADIFIEESVERYLTCSATPSGLW